MMKIVLPILVFGLLAVSAKAADSDDQLPPPPSGKAWKLIGHDEFDGDKLDDLKMGLVVGGLPAGMGENYTYEYDQDFTFVQKHVLPSGHTLMGIQTATFADGHWWFGCYGEPKILLKADERLAKGQRYEFDCSLGIVPIGNGRFLVGRGTSSKEGCTGRLVLAEADEKCGLIVRPSVTVGFRQSGNSIEILVGDKPVAEYIFRDDEIDVDRHLVGGCTLEKHVKDQKAIDKIRAAKWDVVVLQEHSLRPVIDRQSMHEYARLLDAEIKKQGAKTIFYLTWARQHVPDMQEGAEPAQSPEYAKAQASPLSAEQSLQHLGLADSTSLTRRWIEWQGCHNPEPT